MRDPRLHPLFRLTQMRLREIAREPGTLFWIFAFPFLLTVGLGLAFRGTGDAPPPVIGLVEPAPAAWALPLRGAGFTVVTLAADEADRRLASGALALVARASGAEDSRPPSGGVTYRFDPARPDGRLARLGVDAVLQRAWGRVDPVAVHDEASAAATAGYIDFLVPGLIGMNVMSGSMWAVGWAIVNLRVRKLLKRLLATPLRRGHLLLSLMLSRLVVLPCEIASIVLLSRLLFGARVSGSLGALMAVAALGALAFAGLAILVACRAQSIEAVTGLMNSVMLPMFVVSGVFFSASKFPHVIQPVIRLLPLTAFNDALRHVVNDGASIFTQAFPLAVLAGWAVVGSVVAVRIFRWT